MKSFFKNHGPFDISLLLKKTCFTKKNAFNKIKVKNISTLSNAIEGDICFFENTKYIGDLKNTKASFCLIKEIHVKDLNKNCIPIYSEQPLLDFILIASLFYPDAKLDNYKFKQHIKYKKLNKFGTYIDSTVKIGKEFQIGINSTIKKNVIINDGTVIGKIGYGFKYINKEFTFIPHIGHVEIGKNTYIGSNCSIDRGSFTNTTIGSNSMLDNNIHLAHNVKIGSFCFIAGQVGIAGSTVIGNNCMIGGQAGISGHLKIGDNVHIGGHSGVLSDLDNNSKVMGFPAVPIRDFLKGRKK